MSWLAGDPDTGYALFDLTARRGGPGGVEPRPYRKWRRIAAATHAAEKARSGEEAKAAKTQSGQRRSRKRSGARRWRESD